MLASFTGPVAGQFTVKGTAAAAGKLVTERATRLTPPVAWEAVQTNTIPAGAFSFTIPQAPHPAAFFRVRAE